MESVEDIEAKGLLLEQLLGRLERLRAQLPQQVRVLRQEPP